MTNRSARRVFSPLGLPMVVVVCTACTDRSPIGYGAGNAAGNAAIASDGAQGRTGGTDGGSTDSTSSSGIGVGGGLTSLQGANGGRASGTSSSKTASHGGGVTDGGNAMATLSGRSGIATAGGAASLSNLIVDGGASLGDNRYSTAGAITNVGASSSARAGTANGGSASSLMGNAGRAGNSGGGGGRVAAKAGSAGVEGQQWVVEPSSIEFFNLPINSVRWGISGLVPDQRTCVTVIWDYSNTGHSEGAHCDEFSRSFPYVIMTANTDGPCGDWDYGGTVQIDNWTGCVDFRTYMGMNYVNSVVSVTSDPFTGQILFDNRSQLQQPVVVFGIRTGSPTTEALYVQETSGQQIPAWITASKDGTEVALFDRCDIPPCGGKGPNCTPSTHVAERFVARSGVNSIAATWDGNLRHVDSANNCLVTEPASPGNYRAKFCYATAATSTALGSSDVIDPQCVTRDFTYPTEQVYVTVDGA